MQAWIDWVVTGAVERMNQARFFMVVGIAAAAITGFIPTSSLGLAVALLAFWLMFAMFFGVVDLLQDLKDGRANLPNGISRQMVWQLCGNLLKGSILSFGSAVALFAYDNVAIG